MYPLCLWLSVSNAELFENCLSCGPLLSTRLHCCTIQKLHLAHHAREESPVGRRPGYKEIDILWLVMFGVSMETGPVDQLKFGAVVILPEDS